jgi:tetratricopeptide (TPR) repeat protein
MTLDDLVAEVDRRLTAYHEGDVTAVFDDEAGELVGRLRELLPQARTGKHQVAAVAPVAALYYYRFLGGVRGQRGHDVRDLHVAVNLFSAVHATEPDSVPGSLLEYIVPGEAQELAREAAALYAEQSDLDHVIDLYRRAVTALPEAHPDEARMRIALATALQDRFDRDGRPADLDEAVAAVRRAIKDVWVEEDAADATVLLCLLLLQVSEERGDDEARADAVRLSRWILAQDEAVQRRLPPPVWVAFGNDLGTLYQSSGDRRDLDGAVAALRIAERAGAGVHAPLSELLALQLEYRRDRSDIEAALAYVRGAVAATEPDTPDGWATRAALMNVLLIRGQTLGTPDDLGEAIAVGEQLREDASELGSHRTGLPGVLASLTACLRVRFEWFGDRTDLSAGTTCARQLVVVAGSGPGQAMAASALGAVLLTRYARLGLPADLDEAVEALRRASAPADSRPTAPAAVPADSRPTADLSTALQIRWRATGSLDDLDEAIDLLDEVVKEFPDGHAARPTSLSSLGAALNARAVRTGSKTDANRAVELGRRAVLADEQPFPSVVANLADSLWARGNDGDRTEAIALWTAVADEDTAPARVRLIAARASAEGIAARQGPAAALPKYRAAVDLLPLLAWRGMSFHDHKLLLQKEAPALACAAAACAIETGRLEEAVLLLEHGRYAQWTAIAGELDEVAALERAAPDLARRLRICRAVLDQEPGVLGDRLADATARRAAAAQFDATVRQVRALPPTEALPDPKTFLARPDFDDLRPPRGLGPVVILNVARWRTDAIVVTDEGVRLLDVHVPLSLDQARTLATGHLAALEAYERGAGSMEDRIALEVKTSVLLTNLWVLVASPVLSGLKLSETAVEMPRIWWYPTGPLSVLPLHAAGVHGADSGDTVVDKVVSSYAYTLKALRRSAMTPPPRSRDALVVAVPGPPGLKPLQGIERELATLDRSFDEWTSLVDEGATKAAIVQNLGRFRYLHAACRAVHGPSGGLWPHDWQDASSLGVPDLIAERGELAFLSACTTTAATLEDFDEVVTLAAALHFGGWRHAIATQWIIGDPATAGVAEDFYAHPLALTDPARALRDAVSQQRDLAPMIPSLWAAYMHVGP